MVTYSKKEYIVDIIIYMALILISLATLYPFLHVLALSFNDAYDSVKGGIYLIPRKFTLNNYKEVLSYPTLLIAFRNSVLRTVFGTLLNVVFTAMMAYVLSRKDFAARKLFSTLFIITMYVSGGLIPGYLLIRSLGLMNNFMVYIIPGLVWTFCIIVVRSYIEGLPFSLQESAMIDGASDFTIFAKIIFPLCMPTLATIALFYAVHHWNSWFDTYLYASGNKSLTTLQYELQKIIQSASATASNMQNNINPEAMKNKIITPEAVQMAITIVVVTPIIIVYPFLQKYFVKGMTVGAVKG